MGIRENVVLWLMKCLIPSISFEKFMDSYFTYFRLLTHLGVTTFEQQAVLNKNRLRKCTGNKHLQKKGAKILKGRLFSSHAGIRNILSDDDTKYYQVQSEHRLIQNPFKHLS